MASRKGKHREDKSGIGLYVDDDFRAVLALLVKMTGETATDIIMDGVRSRAAALGVVVDGVVAQKHRRRVDAIKASLAERRRRKKAARQKQ